MITLDQREWNALTRLQTQQRPIPTRDLKGLLAKGAIQWQPIEGLYTMQLRPVAGVQVALRIEDEQP